MIFLLTLGLVSCSQDTHLTDNYYIFEPGEFNTTYTLGCKLAAADDVNIDSINYVKWSDNIIMARRQKGNKPWLIVKARSERLKSCNNDTLLINLTKEQAENLWDKYSSGIFAEKTFE